MVYADTGAEQSAPSARWPRASPPRGPDSRPPPRQSSAGCGGSVDGAGAVPQPAAAVEVLVAERRAGLRLGGIRRGRAVHDDRLAHRRVSRPDSALALLHAAAQARQPQWSRVVIWSSGIGTVAALLGIVIGVWMYSPSKRYRYAGAPTSIPYRGQKRWHTMLRPDLRPGRRDLGVQRHAVDGSVSDRSNARSPTPGRSPQALRGACRSWRRSPPRIRARRSRSSPG